VERAQRTHTEEFYELYDGDWDILPLDHALTQWETVYNTVRPHQSLAYRTPYHYLLDYAKERKDHLSPM